MFGYLVVQLLVIKLDLLFLTGGSTSAAAFFISFSVTKKESGGENCFRLRSRVVAGGIVAGRIPVRAASKR